MRIGVAMIVIADLLIRGSDLEAFFTDDGIVPRHVARLAWPTGYWSLHDLNGSLEWAALLFSVHMLAALFLLIGYNTRIASAITFLLYISMHNRNVFINQSGDDLLRMTLMWGIFLPWANVYSVDARRGIMRPDHIVARYAFLIQVASLYLCTAILKYSAEWRTEGTAVYYALSLDQLRLPYTGDWLYGHPALMKMITHSVLVIELMVPLLIFLPVRRRWPRITAVALIVLLHAGISMTLYVGLFFIISAVTAIGLPPPRAGEGLAPSRSTPWVILPLTGLVLSVAHDFGTLPLFPYQPAGASSVVISALRLDHYWGMFSPDVMKQDGWLVYEGIDRSGRSWDLRLDQPMKLPSKPDRVVSTFSSDRWRKLSENMQTDRFSFLKPPCCRYMLRRWNKEHPEHPMDLLRLSFMQKENLAGYRVTRPCLINYSTCNAD